VECLSGFTSSSFTTAARWALLGQLARLFLLAAVFTLPVITRVPFFAEAWMLWSSRFWWP